MISPDERKLWRVVTVPPEMGSFGSRVPICEAWRGVSKEELVKLSGIPDAEFVHKAGFTGGAWSQSSAVKMAEMSLAEHKAANPGAVSKQTSK